MPEKNRYPLVSIIVVTYNSSSYILETLESAKNQTYKKIELIITDDCSTDNTVGICRNWLKTNKHRFINTNLITSLVNDGIGANCNRGLKVSKGEWLKFIAGDDILLNDCIQKFVKNSNLKKIIFGKIIYWDGLNERLGNRDSSFFLNEKLQYQMILKGTPLPAPASFINSQFLKDMGGFEIKYKLLEDIPLWLKMAKGGEIFYCLDEFVVKYRIHEQNLSIASTFYINPTFYKDYRKLVLNEILPELWRLRCYLWVLHFINYIIVTDIIVKINNKQNKINNILSFFVIRKLISKIINLFIVK